MHGKTSAIRHDGRGIFAGLPNPFPAARYHSLVIARDSLPTELRVPATAGDAEIMAVEHPRPRGLRLQVHPETVLPGHGHPLLSRFLHLADAAPKGPPHRRAPPGRPDRAA